MKVEFLSKFDRDLEEILEPSVRKAVLDLILKIEGFSRIHQIPQLKKLQGFKYAYRIRVRDYRIGIFVENNVVQFARIKNRRDIYRVFP